MTAGGLVVGVGARPGVDAAEIVELIDAALRDLDRPTAAVAWMATVLARRDEPGIVAAARMCGWPLVAHSAEVLAGIEVPNAGTIVAAAVGTPSVAEAACLVTVPALAVSENSPSAADRVDGGSAAAYPPGDHAAGSLVPAPVSRPWGSGVTPVLLVPKRRGRRATIAVAWHPSHSAGASR